MCVGGASSLAAASQASHGVTPSAPSQRQPITRSIPTWRAAATPGAAVSGPTNSSRAPESVRM